MKKHKRLIVIITCAVLLAAAGLAAYLIFKPGSDNARSSDAPRSINDVDYSGPTEEEKKAGDTQKEKQEKRDELNKTTPSSTANLTIVDSSQYADKFEVRAYVSNVFEDGGTCTATLTKEGVSPVVQTSTASASATTTQCQTIDIPISSFPSKGDWQLVVSYASPSASGSTSPKNVTIQQ